MYVCGGERNGRHKVEVEKLGIDETKRAISVKGPKGTEAQLKGIECYLGNGNEWLKGQVVVKDKGRRGGKRTKGEIRVLWEARESQALTGLAARGGTAAGEA